MGHVCKFGSLSLDNRSNLSLDRDGKNPHNALMNKVMWVLLVAMLAGCSRSEAAGESCEEAVRKGTATIRQAGAASPDAPNLVARCLREKWSPAVRACASHATSGASLETCAGAPAIADETSLHRIGSMADQLARLGEESAATTTRNDVRHSANENDAAEALASHLDETLGFWMEDVYPAKREHRLGGQDWPSDIPDEARDGLNSIAHSAITSARERGTFPAGAVGLTPSTACCKFGAKRCPPEPTAWQNDVWNALDFDVSASHDFRFAYLSHGDTFEAYAVGSPGCAASATVWWMRGGITDGDTLWTETSRWTSPPTD